MVGSQGLDGSATRQPRNDRDLGQGERRHRQDEIAELPAAPSAGRQPAEHDAEEQRQDGRDHKGRYGDAERGGADHHVVDPGVLTQSRKRAESRADDQRQRQRHGAQLDGNGQASSEQIHNREVAPREARAEIALRQIAEIQQILLPERLIEIVGAVDVFHDQRIERAFEIERTAGRDADHEKGEGDDDEHRRYGAQQTPQHIADHLGFPDDAYRRRTALSAPREITRRSKPSLA
jgi:hypothetical protein